MSELPWIEKHRPKTLDEVVGNRAIVDLFKAFVQDESMPHLIMTGTPGIGKTTIAEAFISSYFKDPKKKKENVLEMNASDERGIEVVRTKIKIFLQKKIVGTRFLVLDESDSMTTSAQHSMRRLLETHLEAKFIFICNNVEKISDTIQSRCAILRLSPLSVEDVQTITKRISEVEDIKIAQESIKIIAESAEGDARQAINLLQCASVISKDIPKERIERMINLPPQEKVEEMLSTTRPLKDALSVLDSLFSEGYSPEDISKLIFKIGKDRSDLFLLEEAAKLLIKLTDSSSSIHFYSLLMKHHEKNC
ncbi:replication factor C subunit 2/4 [Nematocida sp. LUAm3]|nr:replication factor C subunit 2/4 [Nematocida sp. LUAm3]KAI5173938.1 replication factor C subunit 2/4 [Nematocida sp. LUAm2]KAI5177317.1 replication factor C subunit 2/4 [Nematocida sp. LUAm1]